MALLEPFMEKVVEEGKSLELAPPVGRGLKIIDIMIKGPDSVNVATIKVEKTTVAYFYCGGYDLNHCSMRTTNIINRSLMNYLSRRGLNTSIPVTERQTLHIEVITKCSMIKVVYEEWDAADITADMPNGTAGKSYIFVNYGSNSEVITASGYTTLDKSLCPVEFPDFPFGANVPSDTNIELIGIVGANVERNVWADPDNFKAATKHLKLISKRETLFDRDLVGFVFTGAGSTDGSDNRKRFAGLSQLPWQSERGYGKALILPRPVVFGPGTELNVQVDCLVDEGGQLNALDNLVGMILRVVSLV